MKLRAYMKKYRLSCADVAAAIRVRHRTTVARYIRRPHPRRPAPDVLQRIGVFTGGAVTFADWS